MVDLERLQVNCWVDRMRRVYGCALPQGVVKLITRPTRNAFRQIESGVWSNC